MNLTTVSASGGVTLDSPRQQYWLGRIDRRCAPGAGPTLEAVVDEPSRQLASYLEWLELSVGGSAGAPTDPQVA